MRYHKVTDVARIFLIFFLIKAILKLHIKINEIKSTHHLIKPQKLSKYPNRQAFARFPILDSPRGVYRHSLVRVFWIL